MAATGSIESTVAVRALVLAGGLGSRLRSLVPELPKTLAPVGGRPFLEYVLRQLADQGIQDVTICTGYGSTAVQRYADELALPGIQISLSEESQPLGTGGALRLAIDRHADPEFLVLNGDSFFDIRFERLIEAHHAMGADVTIAVRQMSSPGRFGSVAVDDGGWLTAFREKVEFGARADQWRDLHGQPHRPGGPAPWPAGVARA